MPKLYDYAAKEYVPVPKENVKDLVLGGSHGFPEDAEVNILLPNGKPWKLQGREAYKALSLGAEYEDKEDAQKRTLKAEYGHGFGNALLAFGTGGLRGLSLGVSDAVIGSFVDPRILDLHREEFGGAAITGEILGGLAPWTKLAQGAGLVAKAVKYSPAAFAGRFATSAGGATSELMLKRAASQSLLRKTAQVGVAGTIAGGLEGLAFGAGAELSDYVLEDKPKSANQIIANIGISGLFGGSIGGALGAGIVGGIGGAKWTAQSVKRMFEKTMDTKLVDGFTDTIAKAVSKIRNEPLEDVQALLGLGRKHLDKKMDILGEGMNAQDAIDVVKAERYALKLRKTADKIKKLEDEVRISARADEAYGEIQVAEGTLALEKETIANKLSEEEADLILLDMDYYKSLDELNVDKDKLHELDYEAKIDFIRDNYDEVRKHNDSRRRMLEEVEVLNSRASDSRISLQDTKGSSDESIASLKSDLLDHKLESKIDVANEKNRHRVFISQFTENEIELGLNQLRDQGYVTKEMRNLDNLTLMEKRELALDNAHLLFRKAETDAERTVLFGEIQERMNKAVLEKANLADALPDSIAAKKAAASEVRTEMDELLANPNGEFDNLTIDATRRLDELVRHSEAVTRSFQRRGVDGAADAKAGLFDQLLPKVAPKTETATLDLITDLRGLLESTQRNIGLMRESPDHFFAGGDASTAFKLVAQLEDKINRALIKEGANTQIVQSQLKAGEGLNDLFANLSRGNLRVLADQLMVAGGKNIKLNVDINRGMFKEIDDLKRRIQEKTFDVNIATHPGLDRGKKGLNSLVQSYDTMLKNADYFGDEATTMFGEMNAVMSEFLGVRGMMKSSFLQNTVPRGRSDITLTETKAGAIGRVLRNINNPAHSSADPLKHLKRYMSATKNLSDMFEKHFSVAAREPGLARLGERLSGADDAYLVAQEGLKKNHKELTRILASAEAKKNSVDAYEQFFGRRIGLNELPDEAQLRLSGYNRAVEKLEEADLFLQESKSRLRRVGLESAAEAKDFALKTRELSDSLKTTLSMDKHESLQKLMGFEKKRITQKGLLEDLKEKAERIKAGGKGLKSGELIRHQSKIIDLEQSLAKTERDIGDQISVAEADLRESLGKERTNLESIKKEISSTNSAMRLGAISSSNRKSGIKAQHDEKIANLNRDKRAVDSRLKALSGSRRRAQSVFKAGKKKAFSDFGPRERELKRRRKEIDQEIRQEKDEIAKRVAGEQLGNQKVETDLLVREIAAREAMTRMGSGMDNLGSAVLAGVVGSVPFGPMGGVATAMVTSMAKPVNFGRGTVVLWGLADATEQAIVKGLDGIIDGLFTKARPRTKLEKPDFLPQFLGPIAGMVDDDVDTPTERAAAFKVAEKRLNAVASDPELRVKMVEEATKGLDEHPELAENIAVQANNLVDYLKQNSPKSSKSIGPTGMAREYAPSDAEIRAAIPLYELAESPVQTTIDGLRDRTITHKQCEMLQVAYPFIYEQLCVGLTERLADRGEELPYSGALVVAKFLGSEMHPTLSGAFISVVQGMHAQPQEQMQAGGNINALRKQPGREILPSQGPLQSGPGDIVT